MKPVLICGGVGTKMWPASRRKSPKHFLPLLGGKSLFQLNYRALRKKFSSREIYVETTAEQVAMVKKQAPEIPKKNYFIEPEMRNHGPATGFMAAKLFKIAPDEPFILVQVDLLREPTEKFLAMIDQCEALVKKEKKLITGGIRPKYAIMGIDYLVAPKLAKRVKGMSFYQMEKWLGREEKEGVGKYFREKALFGHLNHYCWTPRLMLEAYKRRRPDWYGRLEKMIAVFGKDNEAAAVKKEYLAMAPGPAEEVTKFEIASGYVVELPFQGTDIGTWESLDLYLRKSKGKKEKNLIEIDSSRCFVYKFEDKLIGLIGVNDLVIVDTKDALLVCRKDQSGRVGEIVDRLREEKKKEWF